MFLLFLFLYSVSLIFFSFHPLVLGLRLLFVTTIVGIVVSLFLRPYVGFMIIIIGVGGVLVAIRFSLALVRYWDKLVDGIFIRGVKEGLKRLFIIRFIFLIFGRTQVQPKLLDLNFIYFAEQWGVSVLFVGVILFLRVVIVVFIVKSFYGTLVDFKVN